MSKEVYNEGDLVEAAKGESVARGRLKKSEYAPQKWPHFFMEDFDGIPYVDSEQEDLDGWTITVIEKAKPPVVLPTAEGSGIVWNQGDMRGTRVAMRTGSYNGRLWHYQSPGQSGTSEYTDDQIRALVGGHRFTIVEPVPVTAKKVLDKVHGIFGGPEALLHKAVDAIAAEYGVTK